MVTLALTVTSLECSVSIKINSSETVLNSLPMNLLSLYEILNKKDRFILSF